MKTTITKKGQIVIPAKLRKKYNIDPGTTIHVEDKDGKIVLTPITPEYIRSLRGITEGSGALKMLEEERRKDRDREDARHRV
ncbi:MAG: AbrB/MazE/SpoVT family DNA-binding domain-containing protein [Bacteroidetes bacterium]|nr:AbrB/MazE/SpoVT family DNA-binding domain-containing protein [Bacteroidota bacterium]